MGNLDDTDILIVSSGVGPLRRARADVVEAFVRSGRGAYLQAEYTCEYDTNLHFARMMTAFGEDFSWSGTVEGQLAPVTIEGCFSTDPEPATQLDYFWYACEGVSNSPNITTVLSKDAARIAFTYCGPAGKLITTTDQDFLRPQEERPTARILARNILAQLAFPQRCPGQ
jgi:hypothetical protein